MLSQAVVAPPTFDTSRHAWLVSRFDDVSAALRDPAVVAVGTTAGAARVHEMVRDAAARSLAPSHATAWHLALESRADQLLLALPDSTPIDLMATVIEPWSHFAARLVCGVPDELANECAAFARIVWLTAATATHGAPSDAVQGTVAPAVALAERLARTRGGALAFADVQTFVALAETLPCAVSGSWHVLLQQPRCLAQLRESPAQIKPIISEALRCASPSRAVFRVALHDVVIGGVTIAAREQLVLLLAAANHDSARFPEPTRIDVARAEFGHLAFGDGVHRCAGAPFIRSLLCTLTAALLRRASRVVPLDSADAPIGWRGGFAIGAPDALPVTLER